MCASSGWGGAASPPRAASRRHARQTGATLMELLVVVTIIAILGAIAIPSYRAYALRSHRTDARRVLTINSQVLQRCYSQTFAFNGANCGNLSTNSPNGWYTVVNTVNAQTFTLTATASGAQANDTQCNTFTIDQTGNTKAADSSSNDTSAVCWGGT